MQYCNKINNHNIISVCMQHNKFTMSHCYRYIATGTMYYYFIFISASYCRWTRACDGESSHTDTSSDLSRGSVRSCAMPRWVSVCDIDTLRRVSEASVTP